MRTLLDVEIHLYEFYTILHTDAMALEIFDEFEYNNRLCYIIDLILRFN